MRNLNTEDIRDEKVKVLKAMPKIDEKFVRDVSDRVLFMVSGNITEELTAEEYEKYMRD